MDKVDKLHINLNMEKESSSGNMERQDSNDGKNELQKIGKISTQQIQNGETNDKFRLSLGIPIKSNVKQYPIGYLQNVGIDRYSPYI